MNNLVHLFIKEVKTFSKNNWWMFIIYFILLILAKENSKNGIGSIVLVTTVHFIADIFIMMMFSSYHRSEYKLGTYFQIFSMVLFTTLKLHIGITKGIWHYLPADIIYMLAAYKNYKLDVKNINIKQINPITTGLLSLIIIGILIYVKMSCNAEIFEHESSWVTTLGIFLFAISLTFTGNESSRYQFSIFALLIMVIGAGWETFNALDFIFGDAKPDDTIHGLELSYFLLPLTVLIFNLKSWNSSKKVN